MSFKQILESNQIESVYDTSLEYKILMSSNGIQYPVLFCKQRENRPFRNYRQYTRADCPLCGRINQNHTNKNVVPGCEWMPATWPIKDFHGICFPSEHRAGIIIEDICNIGNCVDSAGDIVACINMLGSSASLPEHFHAQLHTTSLLQLPLPAFPLLAGKTTTATRNGRLTLSVGKDYPAFYLLIEGDWDALGAWITTYLSSVNSRPHNFVLASSHKLIVVPRSCEKAAGFENGFGASEMMGLITPITRSGYDAIADAPFIEAALRECSIADELVQQAIVEHGLWALSRVASNYPGMQNGN